MSQLEGYASSWGLSSHPQKVVLDIIVEPSSSSSTLAPAAGIRRCCCCSVVVVDARATHGVLFSGSVPRSIILHSSRPRTRAAHVLPSGSVARSSVRSGHHSVLSLRGLRPGLRPRRIRAAPSPATRRKAAEARGEAGELRLHYAARADSAARRHAPATGGMGKRRFSRRAPAL